MLIMLKYGIKNRFLVKNRFGGYTSIKLFPYICRVLLTQNFNKMKEIKTIKVKKAKVSNLNNLEMGVLQGRGDYTLPPLAPCWALSMEPGVQCIPITASDSCGMDENWCISRSMTVPCYTYPAC